MNKSDLESDIKIKNYEIFEYFGKSKIKDNLQISIKNGYNIQELIEIIYIDVNESKNLLPLNIVSEMEIKPNFIFDEIISLILIGDDFVGKTTFLNGYFKNKFGIPLTTIGIDKEMKSINIDNKNYKLTVWDTAGQERFRSLPKKYYQNVNGILLFFDVTNESSFDNIKNWIKDVKDNTNNLSNNSLYLIGNKIDREDRVITREKAEKMAKSLGMKYFEASGIYYINVPEILAGILIECHMKVNHINNILDLKAKMMNDFKAI